MYHSLAVRLFALAPVIFSAPAAAQQSFGDLQVLTGPAAKDPVDVVATDLDQDGDLDVLIGAYTGHGLSWLSNVGGGQFAAPATIGPGVDGCASIQAGDLDGDGDDDIVVAAWGSHSVVWLENLGQGQFTDPRPIGAGQLNRPRDVELADIEGDGDLDVVIASRGNRITWAENLGGGTFHASLREIFDTLGSYAGVLHVADFDGDGDADVASVNGNHDRLALSRNQNGGQSWLTITRVIDPTDDYYTTALEGGDLDGDGQYDLAVISTRSSFDRITIFSNVWFGLGEDNVLDFPSRYTRGAAVEDFDGDGLNDLLLAGDDLVVRRSLGNFAFEPPLVLGELRVGGNAVTADLTGDGLPDAVAVSTFSNGKVVMVPATAPGSFGADVNLSMSAIDDPRALVTMDVDADGDLDVFNAVRGSDQIIWFENLGGGALSSQRVITDAVTGPIWLRASDVDADGDLDLLAAGEQRIWLLESLGDTSFAPAVVVHSGSTECGGLHADDLDGDGLPDLLYTFRGAGLLAMRPGLGSGGFGPERMVSQSMADHRGVRTGDVDGDGDPDIVVAITTPFGGRVEWHENLGGTAFGAGRTVLGIPIGLHDARDVRVIDVSSDGLVDIVGVGRDHLMIALNQGNGQFSSQSYLAGSDYDIRAMDVGDPNGDGIVDLIYGAVWFNGSNEIRLLPGFGDGTFGPYELVTDLPDYPVEVHAADLDGDGDDDLLSASFWDHTVGWAEALGVPMGGIGTAFCGPSVPNSIGASASMVLRGSDVAGINRLELVANELPRLSLGYFIGSRTQDFVVGPGGSQGNLCLGGSIARFIDSAEVAGPDGQIQFDIDLANIPLSPATSAQSGESWSFQLWYRDANPQVTSNFTSGVELLFR